MIRLIIIVVLFALSLLTVFKAPTNFLWYVSILATEFSWLFIGIALIVLAIRPAGERFTIFTVIIGIASIVLFALPIVSAYKIAANINKDFDEKFKQPTSSSGYPPAFSFVKVITGINATKAAFKSLVYKKGTNQTLSLDFYPSHIAGKKPCVVVVHGGSWAGGNSQQLPELNSFLVKTGYHVAAINYSLAPTYTFPAPVNDLKTAINFLKTQAEKLDIDTNNFVLLGRSAGGQIVLNAAYTSNDPGIKGVISFYGPTDMVWGYANPSNPMVLDSRKVMKDYLGGTFKEVPQQYINSSATENVSEHTVPTLLIHGKNDPLVGYQHAIFLRDKLEGLKADHYVLTLPWATHGCDYTLNGPSGQLSTYAVSRFLKVVTK